jgi:aspartate aminotransferase-like enzyme
LDNVFARHCRVAEKVWEGVNSLGLSLFVDRKYASNTVTAIDASGRIDVPRLVRMLREEHDVIISGGQGKIAGKIFRIGHLGMVCEDDMEAVLQALQEVLPRAQQG